MSADTSVTPRHRGLSQWLKCSEVTNSSSVLSFFNRAPVSDVSTDRLCLWPTVLLQSRRASGRFDRLLTASLVAVVVLVYGKLLCSVEIDLAGAVRSSGSAVAAALCICAYTK